MSEAWYERLTAMDASFLVFEKPASPLHVSATLLYELGPMATDAGGVFPLLCAFLRLSLLK